MPEGVRQLAMKGAPPGLRDGCRELDEVVQGATLIAVAGDQRRNRPLHLPPSLRDRVHVRSTAIEERPASMNAPSPAAKYARAAAMVVAG